MGNASLDGINGGAALDKEFPIYPTYPIASVQRSVIAAKYLIFTLYLHILKILHTFV